MSCPGQDLKFPVVVILGPNRSGKSTFCQAMRAAFGFVHLCEPRVLLRTGHAARSNDIATASDAKPWVCRHIRDRLAAYVNANGSRGLAVDSPEAVLKLDFLHACLPEACFVLLVSDDDEEYLRLRELSDKLDARFDLSRRSLQRLVANVADIHPRDAVGHLRRFVRSAWSGMTTRRARWRGVRYQGWEADARALSKRDIIAKQRKVAVQEAEAYLSQSKARWGILRRSDLASDPMAASRAIFESLGVAITDEQLQALKAYYMNEQAKPGWSRSG